MSYLEEFRVLLEQEKLNPFFRLWEEYCMGDQIDGHEVKHILELIKSSKLADTFGQFAETLLPLWRKIENSEASGEVLRLILDIQTTNSSLFADIATEFLKQKYGNDKDFGEMLRIVGLRGRHSFRGAISNFILLKHMKKGNFVFHTGGWGVGEVMEMSLLREHALIEFEGIHAPKDVSFDNAFKNLIPLKSDHFLARRFGNPDVLEEEGRKDPGALIRLLLRDLGPKNAQEIKDELCELVIPEKDWSKWWQSARSKIKKDTKIKSAESTKESFILREEEVSHDFRFKEALKHAKGIDALVLLVYNFTRDFPEVMKNEELKHTIKADLLEGQKEDIDAPNLALARKIQISFLLEDIFPQEFSKSSHGLITGIEKEKIETVLNDIEIAAFKKRTLVVVREQREDWVPIFLRLLFPISQNTVRDYIFKELENTPASKPLLKDKIYELLNKMTLFPEAFFWYFQKLTAHESVPFNDKESGYKFLEAFLILLHFVENKPEYRDLSKKMVQLLIGQRFLVIRTMIEGAPVDYLQEFLLIASKCQCFSRHDLKILQNLAEVAQPSMAKKKKENKEEDVIWTTPEGYQKIKERVQHIGTVETVENAREIEAARALGDLRENSEYKFALERRSRLQSELKTLSDQLNQARILTKDDIITDRVGVGVIVEVLDSKKKKVTYTLLGPWDADPDQHILSFQSKFAQAMFGLKAGETFEFQGESYTIQKIKSFL